MLSSNDDDINDNGGVSVSQEPVPLLLKSRFQESRLWRQHLIRTGVVQGRGPGKTLGKTVWLAESDTKVCAMYCFALNLTSVSNSPLLQIGTTTKTYDPFPRNERQIPYPYGFEHDLSLITSD